LGIASFSETTSPSAVQVNLASTTPVSMHLTRGVQRRVVPKSAHSETRESPSYRSCQSHRPRLG
jgi:hypothetical protein